VLDSVRFVASLVKPSKLRCCRPIPGFERIPARKISSISGVPAALTPLALGIARERPPGPRVHDEERPAIDAQVPGIPQMRGHFVNELERVLGSAILVKRAARTRVPPAVGPADAI
jgi:hypothetical protein